MNKYLICCDIDGTLMPSNQIIPQRTIDYIRHLQRQGHLFFVATGRMYLSAKKTAQSISQETGVIASNGGIYSLKDNMVKHPFDRKALKTVYEQSIENNLPLFIFTSHTIYYTLFLPDYFHNDTDKGRIDSGDQERYIKLNNLEDFLSHQDEYISAIIIEENHLNKLNEFKQKLSTIPQLSISSSFYNNIEIMPKGISKAIAIKEIQKYYQIPQERTITFGDGCNDIDMFKVSKYSVAMKNAQNEVKEIAAYQTSSNNDEGVYEFLKHLFKGE